MVKLSVSKSFFHLVSFNCTTIICDCTGPTEHRYNHGRTCATFSDYVVNHCTAYHMKVFRRQKNSSSFFYQNVQIGCFGSNRLLCGRAWNVLCNLASFFLTASLAVRYRTALVLVFWFSIFCRVLCFQRSSCLDDVLRERRAFTILYLFFNVSY